MEIHTAYLSSGYRVCLCLYEGAAVITFMWGGGISPHCGGFFNHHGKKFIKRNGSLKKKKKRPSLDNPPFPPSVRRIEGKERGRYAITSKEIQLDCSLMRPLFLFLYTEGFINAQ